MKIKKLKYKKIVLLFFVFLCLIGVRSIIKYTGNKKLIEEEGPLIEKYLKYTYKNITDVKFETVHTNPTGIKHIQGFVNKNPEMEFDAGIYDEHFSAALNWLDDEKSPEIKPEYELKSKTVQEIKKEETEHQK
ncbi:DUF1433 domain-containing protein [Carnobacterium gallinarum]|uniref:DUF1433 domain-containing protein n=1 Tax=Carnobacterium gallinarum TaxID=2749 RepID=UPI00068B224E|nr:DUF1433 domain-containing protein [Carnobacterium gallinarum]